MRAPHEVTAMLRLRGLGLDTTPDFLLGVAPALGDGGNGGEAEGGARAQIAASLARADGPRLRAALRILSALSTLDAERTEGAAPGDDLQDGAGHRGRGGG